MTVRLRIGVAVLGTGAAIVLGLVWATPAMRRAPKIAIQPASLLADGYDTATLTIRYASSVPPKIRIVENNHGATIQEITGVDGAWHAQIRAGVTPGRIVVRVEFPGLPAASAALTSTLDASDSAHDGTPDFLRLEEPQDQRAFRRWFTFLAEAQYFQSEAARPAEIGDCAALIRYAYREALRAHDSRWATEAHLPVVPAIEPVAKYQYPYTPLGAALFRVRPGGFQAGVAQFAQFADAQTIQRLNTHFLSRDLARALPGDLLFFRQESEHMPFHSMIYLGESQMVTDGLRYVVYHTGPDGDDRGAIRRLNVKELLRYPRAEWRPIQGNPAFLGVYRWNILRKIS